MINEILLANLEKFRNWKGWTWEQLYEYLEVSAPMFFREWSEGAISETHPRHPDAGKYI